MQNLWKDLKSSIEGKLEHELIRYMGVTATNRDSTSLADGRPEVERSSNDIACMVATELHAQLNRAICITAMT